MSLGWFKKLTIESTTKNIISGIVQEVDATLRINPDLTLEEALRLVDKERRILLPGEEKIKADLQSVFAMMVIKAYRYKRALDRDASGEEHTKLVLKIAYDYMNAITAKSKDDYRLFSMNRDESQPSASGARETGSDGRFIPYNDGTVLDTRTNLMWAAKDNGADINWQNAKSYCQNYSGGGHTDWRMPTQDELAGLYDGGSYKNVITITKWFVWASKIRGSEAANFHFDGGYRSWYPQSSDFNGRALPVRSGR